MAFREWNKEFKVETLENGRKDEFGDRIYSYKIMTDEPKEKALEFCKKDLQPSFSKKEKPNVLSPEMIEFELLTHLEKTCMYSYKVKVPKTS